MEVIDAGGSLHVQQGNHENDEVHGQSSAKAIVISSDSPPATPPRPSLRQTLLGSYWGYTTTNLQGPNHSNLSGPRSKRTQQMRAQQKKAQLKRARQPSSSSSLSDDDLTLPQLPDRAAYDDLSDQTLEPASDDDLSGDDYENLPEQPSEDESEILPERPAEMSLPPRVASFRARYAEHSRQHGGKMKQKSENDPALDGARLAEIRRRAKEKKDRRRQLNNESRKRQKKKMEEDPELKAAHLARQRDYGRKHREQVKEKSRKDPEYALAIRTRRRKYVETMNEKKKRNLEAAAAAALEGSDGSSPEINEP
ncbi:hypothetical protein MMC14_003590 [Varicellaria rhodocarpa]|nr:hypothetical protein [Varicellaria rhodocarpa]